MAKTKEIKIVYCGPFDVLSVPLPDGSFVQVERDGTLTTTVEYAKRLLEQNIWQPIPAAKTKNEGSE